MLSFGLQQGVKVLALPGENRPGQTLSPGVRQAGQQGRSALYREEEIPLLQSDKKGELRLLPKGASHFDEMQGRDALCIL